MFAPLSARAACLSAIPKCTSLTRSPVNLPFIQNQEDLSQVAEWFLAAVALPVDVRIGAQDAGPTPLARHFLSHKATDVESHTGVDIRHPPDGLLPDAPPANEEAKGRLSFQNGDEALKSPNHLASIISSAIISIVTRLVRPRWVSAPG